MKTTAYIAIVVAVISLIIGIISRLTITPVALGPGGITAQSFLEFTNTCLLIAIALTLLEILKK